MTDCPALWADAYRLAARHIPSVISILGRSDDSTDAPVVIAPPAGDGLPPPAPPSEVDAAATETGSETPVEEDCQTCPDCQLVTAGMLAGLFDNASAAERQAMATEINLVIDEAGLGSELRLSHFVGQCRQETAGRILVSENLNYSVSALTSIFGFYKNNPGLAAAHGRSSGKAANQQAIANHAYANRIGNGSVASGDGWRFRGRGIKQLTGRGNYRDFTSFHRRFWGEDTDFEANPDLLHTDPKYAVRSGIYFWAQHNLGVKADAGPSRAAANSITDIINKYDGPAGYQNRYDNMRKAYEAHVFKMVCFNTRQSLSNSANRNPK